MRILVVDRFEGNYVICEDDDRKLFAIGQEEMPANVKEGDAVIINDEGEIAIDAQETARRRQKTKKLQNDLWK